MLSDVSLIKVLENDEIQVWVSFEKKDDGVISHKQEQNILSSSLKSNIYSDRLKLTMGPVVKALNNKPSNSKTRFKNKKDCYDLRKTSNKYIINPGESIIVLTNERIKLNGNYACLVVPRISLSDVGVVVSTAYVDPYYDGIMRLHLTNLSDKAYELTVLEAIAQCFFFELSDSASTYYRDHFKEKSVFYGQTWNEILDSDRDPFPTKKDPQQFDKFENLKYQLKIIWTFVKKHSLILILVTNIVVIVGGYAVVKQNMEKFSNTVEQVESLLSPTASEIIIAAGDLYGEKEITIDCAKSDIVSVLCNNDEIHYKIISGDVENQSKIVFYAFVDSAPSDDYEIGFTYVIVRRS